MLRVERSNAAIFSKRRLCIRVTEDAIAAVKGRLLRAAAHAEGGDAGHFVAWDGLTGQPVAYNPAAGRYGASVEHLSASVGEGMVRQRAVESPCRRLSSGTRAFPERDPVNAAPADDGKTPGGIIPE